MTRNAVRTVLAALALDDTGGDTPIVETAVQLARRSGARLHIVHAVPGATHPFRPAASALLRMGVAQARERLAALQEQIPEGIEVSDHIGAESPAAVIAQQADENNVDLIVMSTQRRADAAGHFVGTTADRILRTAGVPCLLVRGAALSLPVRRIGVTTDLSSYSRRALLQTLIWRDLLMDPADGDARIELIHREWSVVTDDDPSFVSRVLEPRMRKEIEDVRAQAPGVEVQIDARVIEGVDPAECISRHARTAGLQLLVVATHGHGAIRRVLIGSVASSLARQAPCAVLIVPPGDALD